MSISYNIVPSTTVTSEGSSIYFEIIVTGINPAKPFFWKNIGTSSQPDFVEGNQGYTPVVGLGSTFFNLTIKPDLVYDPNETIIMTLREDATTETILTSTQVLIIDNSPRFFITATNTVINEGQSVTINLTTQNVANGTQLFWKNVGSATAEDFSNNINSGVLTVQNSATSLTLNILADSKVDKNQEYIIVQIRNTGNVVVATSPSILIRDTSLPLSVETINLTEISDLNSINNIPVWKQTGNLGTIRINEVSEFFIQTNTVQPFKLYYKIQSGNLPPGLKLKDDGTIAGIGKYEPALANSSTNYLFTASVSKIVGNPITTATFLLTLTSNTTTEYSQVYLKPLQEETDRNEFSNFIRNTEIFKPDLLYRPFDENFGVSRDLRMYLHYGLEKTNDIESFFNASNMFTNFYRRRYTLSEARSAVALDNNGNIIYEVIFSEIIDFNVNSQGESLPSLIQPNIYPSSIINMRKKITANLKFTEDFNPKFMKSVQPGSLQELGYLPCVIYCYTLPNKSKFIIDKIRQSGIKFNEIDFEIHQLFIKSTTETRDIRVKFPQGPNYL